MVCVDGWEFGEGINILRGPNGVGKTTLLKIICGLIKPDEGEVMVYNRDPFKDDEVKKVMGFVGHETFLIEDLSGYYNWKIFGKPDIDLARSLKVDNVLNRPIRTYSRGERVKLSISIEISRNPRILILDEPFSSLDNESKTTLSRILAGFKGTVILTAHGDIPIKGNTYFLK